jgi:uncharacterized membrane protein (DUF373 family)
MFIFLYIYKMYIKYIYEIYFIIFSISNQLLYQRFSAAILMVFLFLNLPMG